MIKYFISAGCSFTEVPVLEAHNKSYIDIDAHLKINPKWTFSWPVHVTNHLGCIPKYKGKGASGNGIISRVAIYEVLEALKTYKPEDVLVGIMWSGAYRHEVYSTERKSDFTMFPRGHNDGSNPAFISSEDNFYKVMPYWNDNLSKTYYKHIYDDVGSYMQTMEHILRVQWFLKQHNIKYFMTQYYYLTFPDKEEILNHPDIKYLYDQIDFDNWLKVKSEYDWCAKHQDPKTWDELDVDFKHPNTPQHKAFTDHVILPFLKEKNWIN